MILKKSFFAVTLIAFAYSFTAQAQPATSPNPFKEFVPTEAVFAFDIHAMSTEARAALSKEQVQQLHASDAQTIETALQQIIYLATHYREAVHAGRAATNLYEIYKLDRNEQHRIMALVGLHAIGSENSMRQLSRDVRLERSEKVRRLTNAVLRDYFGGEDK